MESTKNADSQTAAKPGDMSPDSSERIQDFLSRHGGPASRRGDAGNVDGVSGWSETYAADGYVLRCVWSRFGDHHEMKFTEEPSNLRTSSQSQ